MKKILFPMVLISMLILSVCSYAIDTRHDLEDSLIRLHILAQSDSAKDQSIKLAVRDEILKEVQNISAKDTDTFKKAAETAANRYLEKNNIPYRAHAESGIFEFPKKNYMNITLPAGEYTGIRVILGNGNGHNWWCVMYPPLCVSGDSAYASDAALTSLKEQLNNDTYEMITGSDKRICFKILEILH